MATFAENIHVERLPRTEDVEPSPLCGPDVGASVVARASETRGTTIQHRLDEANSDGQGGFKDEVGRANKVRENRLRRIADRRGYRLSKSRLRDKGTPGYGGYMLVAAFGNLVMLGADPYSFCATLEDVEAYLSQADATDHRGVDTGPVRKR